MSVVFLQITNVTRNNSYPTLAAIFPNTNVIKNAMKLVDISANDPNVINIAAIKYKIFSKFSIIIFLNVKKSYIHPKNPVNFPSFFLLKNVKYNTIIVCRSLPYFFLSMSDLIIPLIVDDNGMIRPFELTVEVLKTKIVSNKYLLKNYLDLLCCYVLFGEVSYHEPYNSKNTKYYIFADQVANNCIKFVVAHELTHILLQHEGSKESNEYEADYYGSYMCMCASMNDSFLKEHPMYMPLAIAIAMKSMDVLQKVDIQFKGCESISHQNDRIGILVKALTDMKAVSRQKEIVRVVHSILTLLSYTVDRPLEGMIEAFKRGLIHSIDDVRKYISYL